jgi:hypothetical protein
MLDTTKQNPTSITQTESVGVQDNSTKLVHKLCSTSAYFHRFSNSNGSSAYLVRPDKEAGLVPNGRTKKDGTPLMSLGKSDPRRGTYTEWETDQDGNPIKVDPSDIFDETEDQGTEIKGLRIRFDQPVMLRVDPNDPSSQSYPLIDEKTGQYYMFYTFDSSVPGWDRPNPNWNYETNLHKNHQLALDIMKSNPLDNIVG